MQSSNKYCLYCNELVSLESTYFPMGHLNVTNTVTKRLATSHQSSDSTGILKSLLILPTRLYIFLFVAPWINIIFVTAIMISTYSKSCLTNDCEDLLPKIETTKAFLLPGNFKAFLFKMVLNYILFFQYWVSSDPLLSVIHVYRWFSRSRQLGGLVPVSWLGVPPRYKVSYG